MRVLITGITGLVGSHLARLIVREGGHQVFAFKRWRAATAPLSDVLDDLEVIDGDVTDGASVEAAVERARPDRLYHLAAQSYPSESMLAPNATLVTNVLGTVNVLEAVRRLAPGCRVHLACSSAQYGMVAPGEVPISEERPCRPVNPYGVSKLAQELLGLQYHAYWGLQVYITRSFNHIGPWQDARTSVQAFARQLAALQLGHREPVVHVGNLFPVRDFLDAEDAARALWLLMEDGEPGEVYNLCSGRGRSMQEVLDDLVRLAGVRPRIQEDRRLVRALDEPVLVGSHQKLTRATAWGPLVPFDDTLGRVLAHWREHLIRERQPAGLTGRPCWTGSEAAPG